jgi:copper oxidase (laccase) domain-containing protein
VNDGHASPHASPSRTVVDGRTWLSYARLDHIWLVHGTVVFRGAEYGDSDSVWREELAAYMRRNVRPAPREVVIPIQIHGSRVTAVGGDVEAAARVGYMEVPGCDGLVTRAGGVVIGVNTADCIPLFAVNHETRAVGIAHCGWRGIAAGVIENLIESLEAVSGAKSGRGGHDREDGARGWGGPGGTVYVIGASVGRCCYEVGDDFLERFSADEVKECSLGAHGGKTTFDLKMLVRRRLIHQAIDPAAVFTDNTCTSCLSRMLCSYRAAGDACGRMYSFLMIA